MHTGSGVFHQAAEGGAVGAVTGGIAAAGGGPLASAVGAGLGAIGGAIGNVIINSKPATNAIDHVADKIGGTFSVPTSGPLSNTAVRSLSYNLSVLPVSSQSIAKHVQESTPSSKLHVNSQPDVQQNTSHLVAPTVSLLG